MYHTQECRSQRLSQPIMCIKSNAWLGHGYYFWYDIEDAHIWGVNSKRNTGKYEIYKAQIDFENVMDTVFNEVMYRFWLKQVEKVAKVLWSKLGRKCTLKEINQYFKDRGEWKTVAGILFQDIPTNKDSTLVEGFYYRKRIQIAVFNLNIVSNFAHETTDLCVKG